MVFRDLLHYQWCWTGPFSLPHEAVNHSLITVLTGFDQYYFQCRYNFHSCLVLEFCVLATYMVILICNRIHSWWLYSTAPLGNQAVATMTHYPIQSHYPDTERTSHCSILLMLSSRLGSGKYQFYVIGLTRPGIELPISNTQWHVPCWFGHCA